MSIGSKLKIENKGVFAASLFHIVVGIVFLVLLPLTNFLPSLAILGMFSLVVAYGMFRKRSWTIWFVVILFFAANAFSIYMLYYYLLNDYISAIVTMAYLILTWVFTAYAAAKRKNFED